MITVDDLLQRVGGLDRTELARWIEYRWVVPEGEPPHYRFHDIDIARVTLIHELRRELLVDDEAVPLVLSLLDQLYDARRHMRALCEALADQPEEIRRTILERIRAA